MYLQSARTSFTNKSTESKLFVNGTEMFSVLEDVDRFLEAGGVKIYGETAIPRGIYTIILSYSNRFKAILPEILNVSQFTSIRIHWGNKAEDSEGCLLAGKKGSKQGDNWIEQSRDAVIELVLLMQAAEDIGEEITIEIV